VAGRLAAVPLALTLRALRAEAALAALATLASLQTELELQTTNHR
jgi:hypothetical protein